MAIMKWNTPPQGEAKDHLAHLYGHGEGVALAHTIYGSKVEGGAAVNTLGPNIEVATRWSTAPYTGPPVGEVEENERPNEWGYRSIKRKGKCMANDDTCKAWATKASDYEFCHPHHRLALGKPAWSPNEKEPEAE
jgi:hypothetical protein